MTRLCESIKLSLPAAESHLEATLSANLKLTTGKKFTLIGTPQGQEIKDPSRKLAPSRHPACSIDF